MNKQTVLKDFKNGKHLKIYEWYDGPIVYTVIHDNNLYLVSFYNCSRKDGLYEELVVPITKEQLELAENGKLDARTIHLTAEKLFIIKYQKDKKTEVYLKTDLKEEELPDYGIDWFNGGKDFFNG